MMLLVYAILCLALVGLLTVSCWAGLAIGYLWNRFKGGK